MPFLPWLQASASFLGAFENAPSAIPTRHLAAGCQLLVRLWKRYPKPQFGLTQTLIDGNRVSASETVVLDKAFCRLLHFERATRHSHPVILLVAPLSGHHATLLRDTVRATLPDFDVNLTDWRDGRQVPLAEGAFHLDDYVAYVHEFIDYLGPDHHIVSVQQLSNSLLDNCLGDTTRCCCRSSNRSSSASGTHSRRSRTAGPAPYWWRRSKLA
ncbi:hypothetical protein CS8_015990 [Cupriavidus sp. 8B]